MLLLLFLAAKQICKITFPFLKNKTTQLTLLLEAEENLDQRAVKDSSHSYHYRGETEKAAAGEMCSISA